ncbi:hypothetical protein BRC81_04485 [Halobacteriales archaeon QS_1_68_20]|nr:MAG: hypothetical protein BRC81_04485 [Halobacteriales archaeon QS_1_68_20]
MPAESGESFGVTVDAIHPGTTVRYHYRGGDSLAVVTEKADGHVTFVGDDCNGKFTYDQIDRMLESGRLLIVLE